MIVAPKLARGGRGRAASKGEAKARPAHPTWLEPDDRRRREEPTNFPRSLRSAYWASRDEGLSDSEARAQEWEQLSDEQLAADKAADHRVKSGSDPIGPGALDGVFERMFPGLKQNYARPPRWRAASWRSPPPSQRVALDEFIGPSVAARPPKDRAVAWMVGQYYKSSGWDHLKASNWTRWRWLPRIIRHWLKESRGSDGPVGKLPITAARQLYIDLFRSRHSQKTDEARLELKALRSVLYWGFRRGLWSGSYSQASTWLDRAGLVERGVRDTYFVARWGACLAACAVARADDMEEEAEVALERCSHKRDQLEKAINILETLEPQDFVPLPRSPQQGPPLDELRAKYSRALETLNGAVYGTLTLLFECEDYVKLIGRHKNTQSGSELFILALVAPYKRLSGHEPTVSEAKFFKFLDAAHQSLWPTRVAPSWENQWKQAFNRSANLRNPAKV